MGPDLGPAALVNATEAVKLRHMVRLASCGKNRGTYRDRGAAAIEYAAVLLLATAVMAVMTVAATDGTVATDVERAICRLFGGDCGSAAGSNPAQPPADQCVVQADLEGHTTSRQILGLGDENSDSTQIEVRGDGTMAIAHSDDSAIGLRPEIWLSTTFPGLSSGKVSLGGGLLWNNSDQRQGVFRDEEQAQEFARRTQARLRELVDEHGAVEVAFGAASEERSQIPFQVARDMGVEYTDIDAHGPSAFLEIEVEGATDGLGLPTAPSPGVRTSGRADAALLIGTSRTVGPDGDMTNGDYFAAGASVTGDLGVGVSWDLVPGDGPVEAGPGVEAGPVFSAAQSNIIHTEYDENGAPMRMSVVTTTEFHTGHQGSVQVEMQIGDGGTPRPTPVISGGGEWTWRVENGDVSVTTTEVEIPPDRREDYREEFDRDVADWVQRPGAIRELLESPDAVTTVQNYDSRVRENGPVAELDAGVGIFGQSAGGEVVEWGTSTRTQELTLDDAWIIDRQAGDRRPWTVCR